MTTLNFNLAQENKKKSNICNVHKYKKITME